MRSSAARRGVVHAILWITRRSGADRIRLQYDFLLPVRSATRATKVPNRHAIPAPVSRRIACPASGFGGRRSPREAAQERSGMERALSVQQGEDALLFRE